MHVGIEGLHARCAAIVIHVDHQRFISDTQGLKFRHQSADILINVVQHPEKILSIGPQPLAFIQRTVFGPRDVGPVWGIRGNPTEERITFFLCFNPLGGLGEKHIRAVTLRLLKSVVVQDRRIEILVFRRVATTAWIRLPDTSTTVDEDLIEATLIWAMLCLVTEMPFAEDTGAITGALERLRHGCRI